MQRTTPPAIAFIHIPKTAGVSVAHAFETALGAERCAIASPTIWDSDFEGKRFVSGHVVLSTVTANAWRFTFLRDPLAQLASHLRWLDRYNDSRFAPEAQAFSCSTRAVIARVGATDFASARSLQAFFDWLPADSDPRLVNVQSEVLARRFDRAAYATSAQLAEVAIANLAHLDFVGLVERIEPDLRALFRRLALPGRPRLDRRNTLSSSRRIDATDPAIRAVLVRHVDADLRLHAHVLRRREWWRGWLPLSQGGRGPAEGRAAPPGP